MVIENQRTTDEVAPIDGQPVDNTAAETPIEAPAEETPLETEVPAWNKPLQKSQQEIANLKKASAKMDTKIDRILEVLQSGSQSRVQNNDPGVADNSDDLRSILDGTQSFESDPDVAKKLAREVLAVREESRKTRETLSSMGAEKQKLEIDNALLTIQKDYGASLTPDELAEQDEIATQEAIEESVRPEEVEGLRRHILKRNLKNLAANRKKPVKSSVSQVGAPVASKPGAAQVSKPAGVTNRPPPEKAPRNYIIEE